MIGLSKPNNPMRLEDEPPATRGKSKNQLYCMLAETYFLPSCDSKGVNRHYLIGVFTGANFRVGLLDMKRFEAELTPGQQKKTGLVNLGYILRKLNSLLRERNLPVLGFADHVVPEECWLTKVARFVDRKNVMEFFAHDLDQVGIPRSMSERVHSARMGAHRFIFADNNLMDNQRVFQCVKEISETYRRIISKKIDLEELEHQRHDLQGKVMEEEAHLKASLLKSATTIMAIAQDNFDPEMIYVEGEEHIRDKQQLADVSKH